MRIESGKNHAIVVLLVRGDLAASSRLFSFENLLDNFHSSGIKLSLMTALWANIVLRLFPNPVVVNGRLVLVGDGLKVGKEGKKNAAFDPGL